MLRPCLTSSKRAGDSKINTVKVENLERQFGEFCDFEKIAKFNPGQINQVFRCPRLERFQFSVVEQRRHLPGNGPCRGCGHGHLNI